MKRIAFYLFYDKDGIVDNYIEKKISALNEFVDRVVFISNSKLTSESKSKISNVVSEIIERENIGFDVWGYKEGLEFINDEIDEFDEALFLNYTFFAPIFPFSELFDWSKRSDIDFWGITDHKEVSPNPFTGIGVLPRHIQSHFIAVKRSLFSTKEFKNYWSNMPMIESYQDSILQHESKFTEYFSKLGFKYDVYCNSVNYSSDYPAFIDINETLKNRCPILKRRPFFHDPLWIDKNAIDLRETLEIVDSVSDYDVGLIYENLLRNTKPKDLATNITLLRIFDSSGEVELDANLKVCVIAHVYYADMIEEMLEQVENIPLSYDLIITTATEDSKLLIEEFIDKSTNNINHYEVRVVEENRGRDISALLITCKDIVLDKDYDLVCRLHSKKSPQNSPNQSLHFKKQMYENLTRDRGFVSKLIDFMIKKEDVGFVAPSMVHIGYPTLGHSWFTNKPGAESIAKRLNLSIPFDDFSPFAAYGTMFWFKPKAMRKLFEEKWEWNEFNKEPGHNDGSLSHIIERLLMYVAHDSGYRCFNVMSSAMAELNYTKLEYKTQRIMSNFRNGLVQEQSNMLQMNHLNANCEFNLSFHRKLVRLLRSHIQANYPSLAIKLKKPYKKLVFAYIKLQKAIK